MGHIYIQNKFTTANKKSRSPNSHARLKIQRVTMLHRYKRIASDQQSTLRPQRRIERHQSILTLFLQQMVWQVTSSYSITLLFFQACEKMHNSPPTTDSSPLLHSHSPPNIVHLYIPLSLVISIPTIYIVPPPTAHSPQTTINPPSPCMWCLIAASPASVG